YLPLYMQIVDGVTPTSSGLRLLPLMAGVLTASIVSGRAISKVGRYRMFPIAGTAVMTVGLYVLSFLGVHTPYWELSIGMLVLGIGLGLVMQVLVLAVHNEVYAQDLGVAMFAETFFTSIGGGIVLQLSVFGYVS